MYNVVRGLSNWKYFALSDLCVKLRQSASVLITINSYQLALRTVQNCIMSPVTIHWICLINVFINHSKPDSYQTQWEQSKLRNNKSRILHTISDKNVNYHANQREKLIISPKWKIKKGIFETHVFSRFLTLHSTYWKPLCALSDSSVPNSFCSQIILFWGS